MPRRFIDISAPVENDVPADPPGLGPTIEYVDHQQSLPQILPFFPGLKEEDLPEGQGWAVARVHLTTRNGAHLDALSGEDRARLRRLDAGGCDYRSLNDWRASGLGMVAFASKMDSVFSQGSTL